jgi:hypothetical protein
MWNAGFRWVHFNFDWSEIQPTGTQGAPYNLANYRWDTCAMTPNASCTAANGCPITNGTCSPVLPGQSANNNNPVAIVDSALSYGFSILVTLTGPTPNWARPSGGANVPANAIDFGNFARSAAEVFAGKVYAFEIWSEPNFAENYDGSQAQYQTRILAPAFDAIMDVSQQRNRAMVVGGPGVYRGKIGPGLGGFAGWLTTNGQLVRPIHFLSFHTYFDSPQDDLTEIAGAHSFADTYGIGEVWLTEFGWSSNDCNGQWPVCTQQNTCGNRINTIFSKLGDPAYPKLKFVGNFHGHNRTKNHCQLGCDMGILSCDGSPRPRYNEIKTFFDQTACP